MKIGKDGFPLRPLQLRDLKDKRKPNYDMWLYQEPGGISVCAKAEGVPILCGFIPRNAILDWVDFDEAQETE